ncbi:MAG: hypothetical protein ACMUIE_04485 [Thermoplasmatota archaeon]
MSSKERAGDVDNVLIEMLSFIQYKKGKKPLEGIDPRERIRHSIWTDEGVDLNRLEEIKGIRIDEGLRSHLLNVETKEIKKGLLRRKEQHLIASRIRGLKFIRDLVDGIVEGNPQGIGTTDVTLSRMLSPAAVHWVSIGLYDLPASLIIQRPTHQEVMDISPAAALVKLADQGSEGKEDHEYSKLFERKVPRDIWWRTPSGIEVKDLRSMIAALMESSDKDLSKMLESGNILEFASRGIGSIYLENALKEVSTKPDGGLELPGDFRLRFGRFLMEGHLSRSVYEEFISREMDRFMTCSQGSGKKLMMALSPLMDPRSSRKLQTLVFEVPSKNRTFVIQLMGLTGDRTVGETLKRLHEFSNIKKDRKAAEDALRTLGVE